MTVKIFQPYIPGPEPKVLYHDEDSRKKLYDRINLFQGFPENIKLQAQSVACLVPVAKLLLDGSTYRINPEKVKTLKQFVVNDEKTPVTGRPKRFVGKFKTEPVLGRGTAFLVSKTHILTAGHCFYKIDQETKKYAVNKDGNYIVDDTLVKTTLVVFGFALEYEKWKTEEISLSHMFKIQHITQIALKPGEGDWALVKLKKSPRSISPLELDFNNMIHDPISIYMLGHPSGLPLKYTPKGMTVKKESDTHFEPKIDAFHGSSGSPVFNKAGKVIGMITSGDPLDYERYFGTAVPHMSTSRCIKIYGYEKCQRMTALPQDIRIRIEKLDPGKYSPQEKVIEDLECAEQLIENGNIQEAIPLLWSLSQRGVQIANSALARLAPTQPEREEYKRAAEQSGFFSEEVINKIIELLSTTLPKTKQTIRQHGQGSLADVFNAPITQSFVGLPEGIKKIMKSQQVEQAGKYALNAQSMKAKYAGGKHKHKKKTTNIYIDNRQPEEQSNLSKISKSVRSDSLLSDYVEKALSYYELDEGFQLDRSTYIDARGLNNVQDEESFDLSEALDKFVASKGDEEKRLLILTGDSGAGKTLFGQVYHQKTIQAFKDGKNKLLAIWASLPAIKEPHINLLKKVFEQTRLDIPSEEYQKILNEIPVVLILDAYDELKEPREVGNIYRKNNLWNYKNLKVIITTRPEELRSNPQNFIPFSGQNSPKDSWQEQLWVSKFRCQDQRAYLESFLNKHGKEVGIDWSIDDYYTRLEEVPADVSLITLMENPFALKVIATAFPFLYTKWQNAKSRTNHITRDKLLEEYVQKGFERVANIIIGGKEFAERYSDLVCYYRDFSIRLAGEIEKYLKPSQYEMPVIEYDETLLTNKSKFSKRPENHWVDFFSNSYEARRDRRGCPLVSRPSCAKEKTIWQWQHRELYAYFLSLYHDQQL